MSVLQSGAGPAVDVRFGWSSPAPTLVPQVRRWNDFGVATTNLEFKPMGQISFCNILHFPARATIDIY